MTLFFLSILSFGIALLLSRWFQHPGCPLHILDHPNERSLHQQAVPRSGGIAVILSLLLGWLLVSVLFGEMPESMSWIIPAILLLAVVGLMDDVGHLAVIYRLMAHFVVAAMLLSGGLSIQVLPVPGSVIQLTSWVSMVMSLVYTVWLINLYNFMDGMDGLAGTMGVIGFGSLGMFGMLAGDPLFAALNLMIVSSLLGFLIHNLPPARIFLGDAGSSVLGFLVMSMILLGAQRGIFPLWVGLMVFSPFIFDATYTILLRLLKGEKVWQAHRTHLYQQLVGAGWSHQKTLKLESCVMIIVAGAAYVAHHHASVLQSWSLMILLLLMYIGIVFGTARVVRNYQDRMKS